VKALAEGNEQCILVLLVGGSIIVLRTGMIMRLSAIRVLDAVLVQRKAQSAAIPPQAAKKRAVSAYGVRCAF